MNKEEYIRNKFPFLLNIYKNLDSLNEQEINELALHHIAIMNQLQTKKTFEATIEAIEQQYVLARKELLTVEEVLDKHSSSLKKMIEEKRLQHKLEQ